MVKRCAFSGHRPVFFPWKDNEDDPACRRLKAALSDEIDRALTDGFTYFIVGGAEGVDTWAAEIVLEKRKEYPVISLELAKPFAGYNQKRKGAAGERLRAIEAAADRVTVISDGEDEEAACILRDCYMVDASDRMIVVYDDATEVGSGTKDTLRYAKANGKDIRQIQWQHLA